MTDQSTLLENLAHDRDLVRHHVQNKDYASAHIVEDRSLRMALQWIADRGGVPASEVAANALEVTRVPYSRTCG